MLNVGLVAAVFVKGSSMIVIAHSHTQMLVGVVVYI